MYSKLSNKTEPPEIDMRLNSYTYKGMQRYNNEYAEINIDIKRVP